MIAPFIVAITILLATSGIFNQRIAAEQNMNPDTQANLESIQDVPGWNFEDGKGWVYSAPEILVSPGEPVLVAE